ncbi:IS3 family transposase [Aneurinibacillus uraniidurans]|uniref:IS3 family transposase n=1 Tax=Aneurinibacillus uraniidurans TaxID=2966586 RepID=UPI00234AF900|nr:IS3 family transposase [Aneurinibacillus sp. B1]WCN36738.1 IS3 family transposase [Aneurinibacillus sp. B1]
MAIINGSETFPHGKNEHKMIEEYEMIRTIFEYHKGKSGFRVIKMRLEREHEIIINHKKIRRIMNQYGLITKVRRTNPYKKMEKATHEHRALPNLLNRHFTPGMSRQVLLTDITYLHYGNGQKAYLSCVKDSMTREIISFHLSSSLKMGIAYKIIDKLIIHLDGIVNPGTILHSDQGMHYTHPEFQHRVKKLGFTQSISCIGNCWDNAPMESFFGHMKDEMEYMRIQSFNELKKCVKAYIERYNYYRCQWTLETY